MVHEAFWNLKLVPLPQAPPRYTSAAPPQSLQAETPPPPPQSISKEGLFPLHITNTAEFLRAFGNFPKLTTLPEAVILNEWITSRKLRTEEPE